MNVEFEFIKLNHISEIHKFPEVSDLDSTSEWNLINAIFVPRIIYKEYVISKLVKQPDLSGYMISRINENYLLSYLILLLNSGAFRYEHLKAASPTATLNITLTLLKNFNIPNIPLTLQSKLSHISTQFLLYKNTKISESDRYFEVKASFFRMLCDSMVFQLYHPELFHDNNIDLIGNIDILFPNDALLDFESMFKILSSESNALIDNAKAFTHYFMNQSNKHK